MYVPDILHGTLQKAPERPLWCFCTEQSEGLSPHTLEAEGASQADFTMQDGSTQDTQLVSQVDCQCGACPRL